MKNELKKYKNMKKMNFEKKNKNIKKRVFLKSNFQPRIFLPLCNEARTCESQAEYIYKNTKIQ